MGSVDMRPGTKGPWTVIGVYLDTTDDTEDGRPQRFAESFEAADAEAAENQCRDWLREQDVDDADGVIAGVLSANVKWWRD
jgi:hypothetical protein